MDGLTNSEIHINKNAYSILTEFITDGRKKNTPIPYFEWDTELNVISYNESARLILTLTDNNRAFNKVSDLFNVKDLQVLNEHIHELQTNKRRVSTFSYSLDIYSLHTNIIWLSAIDNNKIISVCCSLQTDSINRDSLNNILKVIPSPVLILSQKGDYISCNKLMFDILGLPKEIEIQDLVGNTIGSLGENKSLCKHIKAALSLAKKDLIKEIQTTFTLNTGVKVYYLFSYCKYNSSVILIGLDITNVKVLERDLIASEERYAAILKSLPNVLRDHSKPNSQVDVLINQLTEDPIFTTLPESLSQDLPNVSSNSNTNTNKNISEDKDFYNKLVRLEVQTRDINVRLGQVESLMFLGESSITDRVKQFEILNETVNTKLSELILGVEKIKKEIEPIGMLRHLIDITPGGKTMFFTYVLIVLVLIMGFVSYLVEKSNVGHTINLIKDPASLIKP